METVKFTILLVQFIRGSEKKVLEIEQTDAIDVVVVVVVAIIVIKIFTVYFACATVRVSYFMHNAFDIVHERILHSLREHDVVWPERNIKCGVCVCVRAVCSLADRTRVFNLRWTLNCPIVYTNNAQIHTHTRVCLVRMPVWSFEMTCIESSPTFVIHLSVFDVAASIRFAQSKHNRSIHTHTVTWVVVGYIVLVVFMNSTPSWLICN